MPDRPARRLTTVARASALALACLALPAITAPGIAAPASPKITVSAAAHPLTVAGYPAFALRDGAMHLPNDGKSFLLAPNQAAAAALLKARGLPDEFGFSFQPLLVRAGARVLLFDTGTGSSMGGIGGQLPASLALAHVRPEQVTDIFISHAHGDHIGGLVRSDGALAFPKATIHLSQPEWQWLRGMDAAAAAKIGLSDAQALVRTIAPKVAPFPLGAALVPGVVRSISIPGHTPGHSAYLIGAGKTSVLYIGDTMHHPVISVERPAWHNSFDTDATRSAQSRQTVEPRWAASGQLLYAYHFPYPGLGRIVRDGGGYRWQAAS